MKILLAHNFYKQPGGEDQVFAAEAELLRGFGHDVVTWSVHNDAVDGMGRLSLFGKTIWNGSTTKQLKDLLQAHRPEIVHFHNTFPLISPAAYYAARRAGAAVVQTLHNFRLLCPGATFFRNGQVCEDCLGRAVPWRGVAHRCYRGNLGASAAVAAMLTAHRFAGTWSDAVDLYITLTPSARAKFIEGGLPPQKLVLKPNFLDPDPGVGSGGGGFALFVGRLSAEKGLETLFAAWDRLQTPIPLKIVGDGPLAPFVTDAVKRSASIQWLGRKGSEEVLELIGRAELLIVPSRWYETFGRVIIEAFAKGTPVIASNHGAMADLVEHGRTGLLFKVDDPDDLSRQVGKALDSPAMLASMRRHARREFEARYTGGRNYRQLMAAYEQALASSKSPAHYAADDAQLVEHP